ncbi:MAG: hypothetical protein ACJAZ9_001726 [Neolewinella sp.]|jgi:hypothetical protein
MSRVEIQEEIIKELDLVDDEMLLVFRSMLTTYREVHAKKKKAEEIIGYKSDGSPVEQEGFLVEAEEINKRMDQGEGTPAEDVYEKTEAWLRSMK